MEIGARKTVAPPRGQSIAKGMAVMTTTSVQVECLTKRFGEVTAVDHLDLKIAAGEFLVLLGPSGCGKTTLLRCIAGLEEPDEGEIIIGNVTVFSSESSVFVSPGQRQVDMVFQSYALWPHMTTFENIAFGLKLKKIPKDQIRKRVSEVLAELGMEGLEKRYPFALSGGQQQRVALARLLAREPPVFLMDEPLSNLDARLRLDMRSELKRLHHDAGATTVYVTHDQTEALTMANRVVVMKDGLIQQVDPPNDLYRKPVNLFVAEFIGAPRINLLSAKPISDERGKWLQVGDFKLATAWLPEEEEVFAAVRPEDITLLLEATPGSVGFQVYAVLPAGPEVFVHVVRGDTKLVVRAKPLQNLEMDQSVWIKIEPEAFNYYGKESGQLLSAAEEN